MTIEQKDVQANSDANAAKLQAKIKETWSKLSSSDLALYTTNRDQFLGKLKENYSLSKEDAEKKIMALQEQCGCSNSTKKAA